MLTHSKKDRNIASVFQPAAFTPDVRIATPARPDPLTILAETESRDADTLQKDRESPPYFSPPPSFQTFLLLPLALTLLPYLLKLSLAMLTRSKNRNIASVFQPAAFTPDVPATPARPDPLAVFAETESRDADTLKKSRNIASVFQPAAFTPDVPATPARPDPLLPYSLKLSLAMLTRSKRPQHRLRISARRLHSRRSCYSRSP